eukprot:TRINITY_DN191516_c0_g1_i1.p1 TRINITY_DN191516_c0_g1~~TRINITY_DN191516_c0_g1_i1.p1  ORF type:complete len:185 (-),score=16.02 TRINITY_DN191516_c0_g1_i1:200-754(-)
MAIKKTSAEQILTESISLFKRRGYYNTSMANIAEACGLIKGSIYHHFKSKDEIGIESLKYIHEYFVKNIFSVAYENNTSPKDRMDNLVKKTDNYFLNSEGGCLLGNLALEVAHENENFKEVIRTYFTAWENALYEILKDRHYSEDAKNLAKEYVSLTQGAIMMMNLYNNKDIYLDVGKKLKNLV